MTEVGTERRTLTRRGVLEAAVDLADREGVDAVTMRRLGQILGVEAMSLYTHVRSKEDLLTGMVDIVMDHVPRWQRRRAWKKELRRSVLDARAVLLRHPWAPALIARNATPGPATLRQYDTVMGIMRNGGFSIELTHHALHLMGSRLLGFTIELSDDSPDTDADASAALAQLADVYPHVAEMARAVTHEGGLGRCDTNVEFEFALDVMLDGLERLKATDDNQPTLTTV